MRVPGKADRMFNQSQAEEETGLLAKGDALFPRVSGGALMGCLCFQAPASWPNPQPLVRMLQTHTSSAPVFQNINGVHVLDLAPTPDRTKTIF